MPELIGGLAELQRSIEYPEMTLWGGIEGKVMVQFIVTHQFELYERYMPFLGPKNFME